MVCQQDNKGITVELRTFLSIHSTGWQSCCARGCQSIFKISHLQEFKLIAQLI